MDGAKRRIATASKTVTGQCGSSAVLQQMNIQSRCYTLFCVGSWSTDSWSCAPKTGVLSRGCKISLWALDAVRPEKGLE